MYVREQKINCSCFKQGYIFLDLRTGNSRYWDKRRPTGDSRQGILFAHHGYNRIQGGIWASHKEFTLPASSTFAFETSAAL